MLGSFEAVPLPRISDMSPAREVGRHSQDKLCCNYEQAQPKPPLEPVKIPSALSPNHLFSGVSVLVFLEASPWIPTANLPGNHFLFSTVSKP